jgi:hypothetical protein
VHWFEGTLTRHQRAAAEHATEENSRAASSAPAPDHGASRDEAPSRS